MSIDEYDDTMDNLDNIVNGKDRSMISDYEMERCYSLANRLIELDRSSFEGWLYLGHLELLDSKYSDACAHYQKVLEIKPDIDVFVFYEYALSLYFHGMKKEAIQQIERAIQEKPDNDEFKELLFDCYADLGYIGRALAVFDQIKDPHIIAAYEDIIENELTSAPYYKNRGRYDINNNLYNISRYPLFVLFDKEQLPEIYANDLGKKYYIDRVGNSLRQLTSEEKVRQKVLSYLVNQLSIPKSWILVEESLAHVDHDLKRRVDILVRVEVNGKNRNLFLIECKEPKVIIEGDSIKQVLEYNEILACPFILITNGDITYCYARNHETGQYMPAKELPNQQILIGEKKISLDEIDLVEWQRPGWQTLRSSNYIEKMKDDGSFIGQITEPEIAPLILNIGYGMLDESRKLCSGQGFGQVKIISDLGVCEKRAGNPSGGSYEGSYRWLKVKDRHGHEQFLYLGVFCTADFETESSKKVGGYSSLVVAIDHNAKPLSVFELNINKYIKAISRSKSGSYLYLATHSGVRNRGCIADLINFIEMHEPNLLEKGVIKLGLLDDYDNFTLEMGQFSDFIMRVISYSLLRFELRKEVIKKSNH